MSAAVARSRSRSSDDQPELDGDSVPHVLFVSPVIPAPLDRGQNVRIHNLVTGLARHFRVTLVVPQGPELELESTLWTAVDRVVAVPPATEPASRGDVLRFMLRHRTLARPGVVSWLQPYQDAIDDLPIDRYSAIWVERLGLARLFRMSAGRVVVDMDDLEHRKWLRELLVHRRAALGRVALTRLYYATRFFFLEVVAARRYGRCAVASGRDATYLCRWGLRNSALLANGASVETLDGGIGGGDGSGRRLVFLGNLGYGPNVDALEHFEDEVRPILDARGVAAELCVLGPGVTDELRSRFPRVDFRGFVADLAGTLREFDVCVVPLRLGGGTKLKVLDAMAAGLPLITTSVGAEGLDISDGVHALVADSPQAFAGAVVRLLEDPQFAGSLGEGGRGLVAREYSWQSVQDRAVALVWDVVR